MKLKKIISIATVFFMLASTVPVSEAADFADGLPEGWTEKVIGNAAISYDDGTAKIQVTGTPKTAASANLATAAKNIGDSVYAEIQFSANDAPLNRQINLTDGINKLTAAEVQGKELNVFGKTAEIGADEKHNLILAVDRKNRKSAALLDGKTIYSGSCSDADGLDFSGLKLEFLTQAVMISAESVFTLYNVNFEGYNDVNPSITPSRDKTVLTSEEAKSFSVNYGAKMNCSERIISFSEKDGVDVAYTIEENEYGFTIIPKHELEMGKNYLLTISGVQNIFGAATENISMEFLIAPQSYNLPTAKISAPEDKSEFYTNERFTITASGESDILKSVELYADDVLIKSTNSELLTVPYAFETAGEHTISVVVTDTFGGKSEKRITVNIIQNQAPTVTILSPTDGQQFAVGDTVVLNAEAADSDGSVAYVEWYENDTLLTTVGSAPYQYTALLDTAGQRTYRAVAYDNFGVSAEASVTVSAESMQKERIFFNDYNNYTGDAVPPDMGGVSTTNGGIFEAAENEQDKTACFKVRIGEKLSGGGPFIMVTPNASGIIGFETDIYTAGAGISFTLRFDNQTVGDVSLYNNSIRLKNGGQTISSTMDTYKWHHFIYRIDTYNNTYSVWVDGECIAENFKSDAAKTIGSLPQIRATFYGTPNTYVMFDNTELYKIISAPYILSAGYMDDNNQPVDTDTVPCGRKKIALHFSTILNESTVRKENFRLADENGNEISIANTGISEDKMHVILTLKQSLASVSKYTVSVSKDVISDGGIAYGGGDFTFTTGVKAFDVASCDILVNGIITKNVVINSGDRVAVRARIANDTGAEKQVLVIAALKKNGRTTAIYSKTVTIADGGGEAGLNGLSPQEDGMTVSVFVWDGWQSRQAVTSRIYQ